MAFLNFILLAISTYLTIHAYKTYQNYLIAKRTRLPIVLSPLDPYALPCQLLHPFLQPIFTKLPWKAGTWWCRLMDTTWSWNSDDWNHKQLGSSVILVCAARNILVTADPETIRDVLARRKDFIKPRIYENLEFFGPNVDTVNGEDWARHRKLTAPCFNERISGFVWDESLRQARSMVPQWFNKPGGVVSNMVEDTRVLALHVLTAAGFGVSHDFLGGARLAGEGHQMSHRDALMTLLTNLVQTIIVSQISWLPKLGRVLPANTQKIIVAIKEFTQYMDEMLANERRVMAAKDSSSKPNLISMLIRTSDEAKAEGLGSSVRLSDEEIKGNIFIFNLAGHDTTANTLAYAVALLAAHPEVQDWVFEEVDRVCSGEEEDLEYEKVFPKLKRVLAVMYETLRLYGPVPNKPRVVASNNTSLLFSNVSFEPHPDRTPSFASSFTLSPSSTFDSSTHTINFPANFELSLNIHASHTNPTIFPKPQSFHPQRWINSSSAHDEFFPPPLGFWPWSGGPRICPGMKFAQVEFVAVMATILKDAKLAPSMKGGRKDGMIGLAKAREELMKAVRASDTVGPTLSLTRPEDVWIEVEKR